MSHRWHIVLNNPTDLEEQIIDEQYTVKNGWWEEQQIKFIYYKKHVNQTRRTPHYHIYIEFKVRKSFNYVRKEIGFSRAHIEKCFENRDKNVAYINNEDKVNEYLNTGEEDVKKLLIVEFID